jgi:hypothetical protein
MPTLLALLLQLALVSSAPAEALGAGCRVDLVPANAPVAWVSAASALRQTLRRAPEWDRDCRQVLIRATPEHASVEVTTRDGRRGTRVLGDARDVEPTVTALIVTVPEETAREVAAPPPKPAAWQPLLVAAGGGRLTLPGTPASMVVASAGVSRGPWELALYGAWSPAVIGASASANAAYSSTAELGLGAARRQPVRSAVLLAGARLGAIRFSPNNAAAQTGEHVDLGRAYAPTLTAFVGMAIPVLSFLRLRSELSMQWVPPLMAGTETQMSLWSLGLNLGAETSLP